MICDKCGCKIEGKLVEIIECHTVDGIDHLTEFDDKAYIYRYCRKCWDEMMIFLISEGKL